jgi:tetratricopeptide (TPR) repeat protein
VGSEPLGDELIGREREEEDLRALLAHARVVLVYGPAGVGKTALLLTALRRAAARGLLPEVVHVSLAGVTDEREALERTARAAGQPRPVPPAARVARELAAMLVRVPRTVIWDDLDERSPALAPTVRAVLESSGPARLVLVSRRFISAREATVKTPVYEVKPLAPEDAVRLVHTLEARRKRTLAEAVADATGGNPLLIQLALADEVVPRAAGDAATAMRRAVEQRATGAEARVLALLAAAGAPLDEGELARAAGRGGREAIDELRKHLLVFRDGGRVALAALAAPLVVEVLGEPEEATWRSLAQIGERTLAASGHDDGALVTACRAHVELGDPASAFELLKHHPIARAAAPITVLDRVLRGVANKARPLAGPALRLLAREALRAGDYDAALRALDDMPKARVREDAERNVLLRAEALIFAGEPDAAQRALDALGARKDEGPAVALTRATLAILRGELTSTIAQLEDMAERTDHVPQLAARRFVQSAAGHLYEERYDLTHAQIARARAAQRAAGIQVEPVVTILDVHALLGLGDVTRAEETAAREAAGRPFAPMLEIAAKVRRGEMTDALERGEGALAALDRRADLLFRSVLARDLGRAALAVGDLARASRMIKLAEVGADEPGLAVLRPICDADLARLAEAEGDLARARRRIDRAFSRIPGSPFVSIDHQYFHGTPPVVFAGAPPVAFAYGALRSAELALADGRLDDARAAAETANETYSRLGLHHETARARLALAEALVRSGGVGAEAAIAACEDVAVSRGYAPLLVAISLVRVALAERAGELAEATRLVEDAVALARDGVDVALAGAAARFGVRARADASRRPYEAVVTRLGLGRTADFVWRIGPRAYLAAKNEPPPEPVACVVDVARRTVEADDRSLDLPEQRLSLLCALAESGDAGATLEELFVRVWRGAFHPLRHRNAVYVALTRLKDSLKPFASELSLSHDGDRYRLVGAVGIRRKADRAGLREVLSGGSDPLR